MGYSIYMIFVGLLGASGFVLSKKPDLQPMFDKVAPVQGFIGIGGVITSILWLLSLIGNLGAWFSSMPVRAIVMIVAIVALFGTSFLLGFSLISTFAGKNPAAKEKADQLRAKLVPYQIPLGFVCIGVGILSIVV